MRFLAYLQKERHEERNQLDLWLLVDESLKFKVEIRNRPLFAPHPVSEERELVENGSLIRSGTMVAFQQKKTVQGPFSGKEKDQTGPLLT